MKKDSLISDSLIYFFSIVLLVSLFFIKDYSNSIKEKKVLHKDCITEEVDTTYYIQQIDSLKKVLNDIDALVKAIHMKESSLMLENIPKGSNNDIGPFQITPIAVKEYNQLTGCNYLHSFCEDYNVSKEICLTLLNKGVKMYYNKHNKYPTIQQISRMWNGGIYNGYNYASTIDYGNKVNQFFNKYKEV